jgi:hypothetical protein
VFWCSVFWCSVFGLGKNPSDPNTEHPGRSRTMSGQQRKWRTSLFLWLPVFALTVTAARADTAAHYTVGGSTGAALWGLGDDPGTEALAFAFSAANPLPSDPPAPGPLPPAGPRLAFVVTQWAIEGGNWVQHEWYGDVPLTAQTLAIAADLTDGQLDATVLGTLVENSVTGTVVQQGIPGRVQVHWMGESDLANTTLSYTYQTPDYTAIVQTAGPGRLAMADATVTVDALGAPIPLWGFGSLSALTDGVLSVAMQ